MIAVKDNQPKLHNHIKRVASERKPTSFDIRTEKTRDRVTTRKVEVFDDLKGIDPEWTGIKSLIKVERTGTRAGKEYHEIICYISSLMLSAKEFSQGIRGHWGIENRLHWVKDVVYNEDHSNIRTGNGAANLSIVKAIALNIFRRNGHASITTGTRFLSHDIDKLLQLVE